MLPRRNRAWDVIAGIFASLAINAAASAQTAFISEAFPNPPGSDNGFEAIEITGAPGASLDGWVLAIIDGDSTISGVVKHVVSLSGLSLGSNGLLLLRDAAAPLRPEPDEATTIRVMDFNPDIENGSQTLVLGIGPFPSVGTDLDADNDGTLDAPIAGFTAHDAVAYTDAGGTDSQYADDFGFPAANLGGPPGGPSAIYRIVLDPVTPHSWAGGTVTGAHPGPYRWTTSTFGWLEAGVPDSASMTLDFGRPNFVFDSSPRGGCCFPDTSCLFLGTITCARLSGVFQGENVNCENVVCPKPEGACCSYDNTCTITTAALCRAEGGIYQGDNTACPPEPCPQRQGACCLGDGTCAIMGDRDCTAAGGAFRGEGSVCEGQTCASATPGLLYISELLVDAHGEDQGTESIEIVGPAGFNLDGWLLLVIDGDPEGSGVVKQKLSLRGMRTGTNGVLLIRDTSDALLPPPPAGTTVVVRDFAPDIENGSNTFALGYGHFHPRRGEDIDIDDDGAIDVPPGSFVSVDAVAYRVGGGEEGAEYAHEFRGQNLGALPAAPAALYRILNAEFTPTSWAGGLVSGTAPGPFTWIDEGAFGWSDAGVPAPSERTLDLGVQNYVSEMVTGGCCFPAVYCLVLPSSACGAQGGLYRGDERACADIRCARACNCDWDDSGTLSSQDFFDFINDFFAGGADYNDSGATDSQDFFDFIGCFFTGC